MQEFAYDDAGRVVRVVTRREPEWSQSDVDLLVASRMLEASIGSHGQPLDESMSPSADPSNWDATHTYEAFVEKDFAQKAKADHEDALRKALPKGSTLNGVVVRVRKKLL